jgi:hypothetical protein
LSSPDVITSACYFHLSQIIVKQLGKLSHNNVKLIKSYGDSKNLRFTNEIHQILALSYLSPQEIVLYFMALCPTLSEEGKVFALWFGRNYVTTTARYPTSFWSVAGLMREGMPKTQTWCESFHHQMHAILANKHVPLYSLIKFFKDRIVVIYSEIDSFEQGIPTKKRSRKYEQIENAVKLILERKPDLNCDSATKVNFLSSLARHVSL